MAESIVQKQSNILDPVHDTLDQDVFNGTKPKSAFFEYHLDHIREVFRQNNFNPYAFDFYLTGSLCTYQYSEKSDVDISIVCNADEFDEEDRADLIAIVIESLDGEFFPRTKHQYQHFVQPVGVDIEDLFILGLRSAWDFQKDEWVLKPRRDYAHNIQKEKPDWILAGVQVSDKINTLIDYHQYEKAKEMYKEIHRRRKEDQIEYGDYSEGNIIYKFLDNNGTFDRLRNIGQKIANQKIAYSGYNVDHYAEDLISSRLSNKPTHLNSRGMPCACGFGNKNTKRVREYYDKLKETNSQFFASLKSKTAANFYVGSDEMMVTELEEGKQRLQEIFNEVVSTQLNPDSRWAKRYPVQFSEFLNHLNNDSIVISDQNIKYLKGAINIFKKEVEKISDTDIFANCFVTSLMNSSRRPFKEKAKHDYYELFRTYSTNNYGRGFGKTEDEIFSNFRNLEEKYNNKVGKLHDKILNFIYSTNFMYPEKEFNTDDIVDFLETDLEFLFKRSDLNSRPENFDETILQIIKERIENQDNVFPLITSLYSINDILNNHYNYYNDDLIFKNRKIWDSIIDIVKFRIDEERPEKILDSLFSMLNPTVESIIGTFDTVMNNLRSMEMARITKEYRIPFPANINEIGSFEDVLVKAREIYSLVKEREEYKKLLEDFSITDYDDSEPIYEVEFKPGNPEKAMPGKWGVYEIETTDDMELEGRLMDHCVGSSSYDPWNRRNQGMNTVYSVRDPNGIPHATLELDVEANNIAEARGRHNQHLTPVVKRILNGFFGQESFQRNSDDPTRYTIRQANGEEVQYNAKSLEDALEQHKQMLKTTETLEGKKEKVKELKAVAGYGSGHNWFSVDEESRTGTNWGYSLRSARTAYPVELTYDDYYDVSTIPSDFGISWDNSDFWDWSTDLERSPRNVIISELLDGLNELNEEDMDVDEMEVDDYGDPYYYEVKGLTDYNFYEVVNLHTLLQSIDSTVEHFSELEDSEEFVDYLTHNYLTNSIKGFGVALSLFMYTKYPKEEAVIDYLDFYIEKYIDSYQNVNKNVVAALVTYREFIKDLSMISFSEGHKDTIQELNNYINDIDIEEAHEVEVGSYNYSMYDRKYYRESENIQPEVPTEEKLNKLKQDTLGQLDYSTENYENLLSSMKYSIELINQVEMQLDSAKPLVESEEKTTIENFHLLNRNVQELNKIITTLREFFGANLSYLSNSANTSFWEAIPLPPASFTYNYVLSDYLRRAKTKVKVLKNTIEFNMNQIFFESQLKAQKGQISFYDMPPEPTDEQFKSWELENQGLGARAYRTPESLPYEIGYING